MNAKVNWTAVVVAAIVYFVIGAVWYITLTDPWLAGVGKTEAQIRAERPDPTMAFLITFLCNLILASVLAQVIVATAAKPTAFHGIRVAFIAWAGFIATTLMMNYQFEVRTFTLWAINAGYPLVGMLVMGAILGAWTKKDTALVKTASV